MCKVENDRRKKKRKRCFVCLRCGAEMRARGHGKKTGRGGEEGKVEKVKKKKEEGTQFVRLVSLALRLVPTSKHNNKKDEKRQTARGSESVAFAQQARM